MPAPGRRVQDREERERLIVRTARELAEREGWGSVTTRRLSEAIRYSQPVLYSHFSGMSDVVAAVALDGFVELAGALRDGRVAGRSPRSALLGLARAYLTFAAERPAVYDAMFTLAELPFAKADTPPPLHDAFAQFEEALRPFVSARTVGTHAEVVWSALHGLALLSRSGRLRPEYAEQRLRVLLSTTTASKTQSGGDRPSPPGRHRRPT